MKLLIPIMGVVLLSPGSASSSTRLPPPDAGVSEQQLMSMGDDAVPFLIGRLRERRNEGHFAGIVYRLSVSAMDSGRDDRIFRALKEFVELNSAREKVPFETYSAMSHALRTMGYAGGDDAVSYLVQWVKAGYLKVKCQDRKGRVESRAATLRDAAVTGLGLSGNPKATEFLKEQAAASPDVPYKGSYLGAIEEALKNVDAVKEKGVKEVLRPAPASPTKAPGKDR